MERPVRQVCQWLARATLVVAVSAVLLLIVGPPTPARAQTASYNGWCTVLPGNSLACYGTPLQACQVQWEAYGGPGAFEGYTDYYLNGVVVNIEKQCQWQDVHHSLPSLVTLYCNNTFAPCPVQTPPCPNVCGNSGGDPIASTPKPIDILSGNKRFTAVDFANQSKSLELSRTFNGLLKYASSEGHGDWSGGCGELSGFPVPGE
jgi:hypothetical protein